MLFDSKPIADCDVSTNLKTPSLVPSVQAESRKSTLEAIISNPSSFQNRISIVGHDFYTLFFLLGHFVTFLETS